MIIKPERKKRERERALTHGNLLNLLIVKEKRDVESRSFNDHCVRDKIK